LKLLDAGSNFAYGPDISNTRSQNDV